jgi:hypothetical protein
VRRQALPHPVSQRTVDGGLDRGIESVPDEAAGTLWPGHASESVLDPLPGPVGDPLAVQRRGEGAMTDAGGYTELPVAQARQGELIVESLAIQLSSSPRAWSSPPDFN